MEQKRLYRSGSNSVIAGVCGGLGEYLDTDPVLFRVLFILAALFGGGGILVYIVLWIVVPYHPFVPNNEPKINQETMNDEKTTNEFSEFKSPEQKNQDKNNSNMWGGLILITLGALFLIDRFVPRIDFGDLWPVILIVVGVILISKTYRQPKS